MHFMKASIIKFLKFTFFSLGAAIVEITTNSLILLIFGTDKTALAAAVIASMVTSCTFSFTMNRHFTFKSRRNLVTGLIQYIAFYSVLTYFGVKYVWLLVHIGVNPYLADPIKMVSFYIFDYSFCNLYLFRDWSKKKNKDKEISVAP